MLPVVVKFFYETLLLLGCIATVTSLYSLILGRRFSHRVHDSVERRTLGFQPHVSLIMPCKGDEPNLEENTNALLKLNYPSYRVMIVTDSENDPAYWIAEKVLRGDKGSKAELLTSTQHTNASGKVSALLKALEKDGGNAEVYAFIDSDATIHASWLADLVDPLGDPTIGATTGFRWYMPTGFWSEVQSAWNASGSNLMFDDKYNFPWGGAMAVRTATLNQIHVKEIWKDAISDDLTLNMALREHGYRILFQPQCTVVTFAKNVTRSNFLKWAINQTTLTRTYHRKLWNYALAAYLFLNLTFVLGLVAFILGFLQTSLWFIPAVLLLVQTPVGVIRSQSRTATFKGAIPWASNEFKSGWRGSVVSLIVPWIMTYCIFKSISRRGIEWRGRSYSLRKVQIATS